MDSTETTFLKKHKNNARLLREKYPNRIPIIVSKDPKSDISEVDKKKYLVPDDYTVGQFVFMIRKRIVLPSHKAMFIFIDNVLPSTSELMTVLYEKHKDPDEFLYITYSGENTFGAKLFCVS